MTNEEKAVEIALENVVEYHTIDDNGAEYLTHCYNECKKSALEMAAWKDKQFSDRVEMTLCIDCHEFESCDNCPKYQIKKELLKL